MHGQSLNFLFPNDIHIMWSLMIVLYPYITGLVAGGLALVLFVPWLSVPAAVKSVVEEVAAESFFRMMRTIIDAVQMRPALPQKRLDLCVNAIHIRRRDKTLGNRRLICHHHQ